MEGGRWHGRQTADQATNDRRAGAEGNAAVGSVIMNGDDMVAKGRNIVTTTIDPTAHAETVVIREAGKAIGHGDLTGFTLYTTFEPSPMCCGAIMTAGLGTVVMGARSQPSDRRWGEYTVERLIELAGRSGDIDVVNGVLVSECEGVRQRWEAARPPRGS